MPSVRDPWLDNVKFVLVAIVVVGHALVLTPSSLTQSIAYDFIYYFHIPAFALITGYLSRSFTYSRRHLTSLVTMLALPYVVFSYLMMWWRHLVGGEDWLVPLLLDPHWPMWYLVVTLIWRLLTPVLRWHWVMVPLSIVVSMLAGNVDAWWFDLNRAMGLLPFFTIGLHLTPKLLDRVHTGRTWVAGLVIAAGLVVLSRFTDSFWSTQWLYFRSPYADFGASPLQGAIIRACLITVSLLGCFMVLSLVPRTRSFISSMGAASLVIYLCHGFVIRGLEYAGYEDWMPGNGPVHLLLTLPWAIALAMLLGWVPVTGVLSWIVDPINTWKRHRTAAASATGS